MLRRVRLLRDARLGYAKIAGILNGEGLKPKRAAAWSSMSVRSVLLTAQRLAEAA